MRVMRRPFIVAEMSANHLGDLGRAKALVHAAADAGADAIKLQTWSPDAMVVNRELRAPAPWSDQTLFALYRDAWTPWDWHAELFALARECGLFAFSAAFDVESVQFLESLGVPCHKVASNEITDWPLIRAMARTRKPLILSAGCASLNDLKDAVAVAEGCGDITILQCTSAYPAPVERANLRRMETFQREFGCSVGLSDHTRGIGVAVAAAACGASYIEKHLTLSRADGGPDAQFSLEPAEFAEMVSACRDAAAAVGDTEAPHLFDETLRRSLWVVRSIDAGDPLVLGDNVRTARPAMGLPCGTDLHGLRASRDLEPGEPLVAQDIAS